MFYYLLYNSSFSFVVENRLFSTILYGSILYILTHAVLNYCDISILNIVNNYYWTLFTLDIISFLYAFYQSITDNNPHNELNVSFNLLKNKINTIIDRKNDLTITQSTVLNKNNTNSNNSNNNNNINNINNNNNNTNLKQQNVNTTPLQTSNKFSTPISQLQNINQGSGNSNQQGNQASTPISLIRNNVNIVEPFIDMQDEQFNQYAESNTGSDLGSLMDLADFENSL
jgi:hypothetical protein